MLVPPGTAEGDRACSSEGVRSIVEAFVREAQAAPDRAVQEFIAPEPLFEWFSAEDRIGGASRDRETLADFLRARHAGRGQSELVYFRDNGRRQGTAHFEFQIRNSEGDTSAVIVGKGALHCGSGTIVVWSQGPPSSAT
jgi:hypothetical protein